MKLKDYLSEVRIIFGDCEKILFQDVVLIQFFTDALFAVFQLRPDVFSRTLVVKLQEGDLQKPCGCTYVQKIEAITDHNGIKIRDIRRESQNIIAAIGLEFCGAIDKNEPAASYDMALSDPTEFTVFPPVLPGQDVYVRVQCSKEPDPLPFDIETDTCFPIAIRSILKHYVLSRMYATETESQTSRQKSIDEMNLFIQSINANRNAQAAYQANLTTKLQSTSK